MKKHYEALDGLRGVAAVAVVIFHFCAFAGYAFPAHGYLAVDFFFVLSGFVIAFSYEQRLMSGLSVRRYLLTRLVRLGPMIVAGAVVGAALALVRPATYGSAHLVGIAAAFVLALVMIPNPLQGDGPLYPLNVPIWSLAWEILVNSAHAVAGRALTTRRLCWAVGLSALGLVATSYARGGLMGASGWPTWWVGFPRVTFSFLAGVLLFRVSDRVALPPLPIWAMALVLSGFLLLPSFGSLNWLYDAGSVLVGFPAIVAFGASIGRGAGGAWRSLGVTSYPLYAIHYPLITAMMHFDRGRGWISGAALLSIGPESAGVVLISYAFATLYDKPVRAWLKARISGARGR